MQVKSTAMSRQSGVLISSVGASLGHCFRVDAAHDLSDNPVSFEQLRESVRRRDNPTRKGMLQELEGAIMIDAHPMEQQAYQLDVHATLFTVSWQNGSPHVHTLFTVFMEMKKKWKKWVGILAVDDEKNRFLFDAEGMYSEETLGYQHFLMHQLQRRTGNGSVLSFLTLSKLSPQNGTRHAYMQGLNEMHHACVLQRQGCPLYRWIVDPCYSLVAEALRVEDFSYDGTCRAIRSRTNSDRAQGDAISTAIQAWHTICTICIDDTEEVTSKPMVHVSALHSAFVPLAKQLGRVGAVHLEA